MNSTNNRKFLAPKSMCFRVDFEHNPKYWLYSLLN